MNNKKRYLVLILIFYSVYIYSISLEDVINYTLNNNFEIKTAEKKYQEGIIISKTLNGSYTPEISFSSLTEISDEYNWDSIPDMYSSSINYTQPLPGGMTVSLGATYSFNSILMGEERGVSQNPTISISLTQSLFPFWVQKKIKDPIYVSSKQKKELSYYELLYIKKNVLQNLIHSYMYAMTTNNEMIMSQNSIELYERQINALKMLEISGKSTHAKILELENIKWNEQQNLISIKSNYLSYVQKLKSICGLEIDKMTLEFSVNFNTENQLIYMFMEKEDPLELFYKLKIDMLKCSRIIEKQNSAPTVSFAIQPKWAFEITTIKDWKTPWTKLKSPNDWIASIGLNLSPMLSGIAKKNEEQYNLDYEEAINSYLNYLQQKNFIKQQYKALLEYYLIQKDTVSILYESALKELHDYKIHYDSGAISELDYKSICVRVENCRLSKECIELYCWLYDLLYKMN